MILGRVCGTITSTIAHKGLDQRKLMIVEKLNADRETTGAYVIAVDNAGTGAGETVLVLDEGNGARQVLGGGNLPIRTVIVGVVDQ
jgi:microcompartment protein CcmK/EutM